MDIRKVKKLIELLEESSLNEIEIKEGEESVRISRSSQQSRAVMDTTLYHYDAFLAYHLSDAFCRTYTQ